MLSNLVELPNDIAWHRRVNFIRDIRHQTRHVVRFNGLERLPTALHRFRPSLRSMSRDVENISPGSILKNARLAMGLSLSEVAAISRITHTMLGHLEANRFDEYSADVFVRGHLRGYARELRLDPEIVIQAFERHTGVQSKSQVELPERRTAAIKSISKAKNSAQEQVAGFGAQLSGLTRGLRVRHLVALGLVLVFIFILSNVVNSSRATAKDSVEFPTAGEEQWEVEQAAQETRWALEQPAETGSAEPTHADGVR